MTSWLITVIVCVPWSAIVLGYLAYRRRRRRAGMSQDWLKQLDRSGDRVEFHGVSWSWPFRGDV